MRMDNHRLSQGSQDGPQMRVVPPTPLFDGKGKEKQKEQRAPSPLPFSFRNTSDTDDIRKGNSSVGASISPSSASFSKGAHSQLELLHPQIEHLIAATSKMTGISVDRIKKLIMTLIENKSIQYNFAHIFMACGGRPNNDSKLGFMRATPLALGFIEETSRAQTPDDLISRMKAHVQRTCAQTGGEQEDPFNTPGSSAEVERFQGPSKADTSAHHQGAKLPSETEGFSIQSDPTRIRDLWRQGFENGGALKGSKNMPWVTMTPTLVEQRIRTREPSGDGSLAHESAALGCRETTGHARMESEPPQCQEKEGDVLMSGSEGQNGGRSPERGNVQGSDPFIACPGALRHPDRFRNTRGDPQQSHSRDYLPAGPPHHHYPYEYGYTRHAHPDYPSLHHPPLPPEYHRHDGPGYYHPPQHRDFASGYGRPPPSAPYYQRDRDYRPPSPYAGPSHRLPEAYHQRSPYIEHIDTPGSSGYISRTW
ncbi:hypothetical protein FIBSPDRAFT_899932 [Athelia psychrophila]|uniref:Uncharacterized protein n=1 Tax=Athelia psychrophila TaxID=1759441 RepID=A0A165Z1Z2_9AGAM|nr:hypothetical protein FIBSPDRAFT_899932 [Fibularhizoctonia sp. CBS 109695]